MNPVILFSKGWSYVIYSWMKQSLVSFRKDIDNSGKYDAAGLFSAKKEIYDREISFANHADAVTERHFSLKTLQVGFLQSYALKDDPKFKEIQEIYAKFNEEVPNYEEKAVGGLHFKKVVMEVMLGFMNLTLLANSAETRQTMLSIAHRWFMQQLNPKSMRKDKKELQEDVKKLVIEKQLLPVEILQRTLGSKKREEQMHNYLIGARTEHSFLDAPSFQLEEYHTHKVNYVNEEPQVETEQQRRNRKLKRTHFPKPDLRRFYLPVEPEPVPEPIPQPPKDEPLISPEKLIIPGENIPNLSQLELANSANAEEEIVEEEEVVQEKQRGKLDPFVKGFMLRQHHQRSKTEPFEYPPVNNAEQIRKNYKDRIAREDLDIGQQMKEWANYKGRLKTSLNRKMQSTRSFLDRPGKAYGVIGMSRRKTRISEAIREGRSYLQSTYEKQSEKVEPSLSMFDRKRAKTTGKDFQTILNENRRETTRDDMLDEIRYLKQKLAKQKIFAPIDLMKSALLHPDEHQAESTEKCIYPSTLLANPFAVKKKKKKKTKKK